MKKIFMMVTAFGMMAVTAQGQACDTLRGNLTSRTLTPSTNYVLEGVVVVPDGETLTIRPGVTICAMPDAGLVVDKGGMIEAIGKADSLITFTSVKAPHLRAPGDWRGIAIMGKAENNETGKSITIQRNSSFTGGQLSPDDNDNSGSLAYVSIEYAGQNYTGDNFRGGLLLNCVGDGTDIHHVQVLNPLNAGLTLLGGKVNAQDIYIQNTEMEDLYIDFGYRGTLTDLLAIKNPTMASFTTDAKGIYVSNHPSSPTNTPLTNPTIDAFTLIGPQQCDELTGDVSTGIYFDNNGGGTFKNGVVSGYFNGLYINDLLSANRTQTDLTLEYVSLVNNINENYTFNTFNFSWFGNGCGTDMQEWIEDACDNATSIQVENFNLQYDNSICEEFCEDAPLFQLSLSELQEREFSSLKVGVLQESPVFTWVQTCPAATCCETSPQARILPLEAYPNPVQHIVTLLVPDVQDQHVKVQVIEMTTGRIFYQQVQVKKEQLTVDMSKLPQGNYKVQIVTELATYQATINKD